MSNDIFGERPWKSIPLAEPVHVEPGKQYEVFYQGSEAIIREVTGGGLTFLNPGTVTAVSIYGLHNPGSAAHYVTDTRPEMNVDMVHKHGQHGWHTHTADEYRTHQSPIDDERGPMPVIGGHPAQLSDGFHTMEELYEHRRALTAVLAAAASTDGDSWRSKQHHPANDPMFDGYFIVGINLPTGPITYHYKLKHWDDFAAVPEVPHAPKWDGASPADSVTRMFALARDIAG